MIVPHIDLKTPIINAFKEVFNIELHYKHLTQGITCVFVKFSLTEVSSNYKNAFNNEDEVFQGFSLNDLQQLKSSIKNCKNLYIHNLNLDAVGEVVFMFYF